MSEKVKHYFEEFIKKSILLVINSRIKPKNELKLQYETLSLTSDNKSKCDNLHKNNSNDFFDIDDLFLDEYDVLTYAKGLNKRYTIDIFVKRKKRKLLIERWSINYFKEEYDEKEEKHVKQKLESLLRSIISITRFLPAMKYKDNSPYEIYYKFYQNYKKEKFEVKPIIFFNFSNSELNLFSIKVEYITNEQIDNFFNNKTQKNKLSLRERPRYFSETFTKKPSFEVLCLDESKDTVITDDYFAKRKVTCVSGNNPKNVKTNFFMSEKHSMFEPIKDDDEEENDEEFLLTESNEKETVASIINKRMKTSDTTSFESSNSFQNSYELDIDTESSKKSSSISKTTLDSIVSSFSKIKRKTIILQNHPNNNFKINLYKLNKLLNKLIH